MGWFMGNECWRKCLSYRKLLERGDLLALSFATHVVVWMVINYDNNVTSKLVITLPVIRVVKYVLVLRKFHFLL